MALVNFVLYISRKFVRAASPQPSRGLISPKKRRKRNRSSLSKSKPIPTTPQPARSPCTSHTLPRRPRNNSTDSVPPPNTRGHPRASARPSRRTSRTRRARSRRTRSTRRAFGGRVGGSGSLVRESAGRGLRPVVVEVAVGVVDARSSRGVGGGIVGLGACVVAGGGGARRGRWVRVRSRRVRPCSAARGPAGNGPDGGRRPVVQSGYLRGRLLARGGAGRVPISYPSGKADRGMRGMRLVQSIGAIDGGRAPQGG